MVVPSLNVLLIITELPALPGHPISARLLSNGLKYWRVKRCFSNPSLIISSASLAVCTSTRACFSATSLFEVFAADEFVFEQLLHAVKIRLCLFLINFRQAYTAFRQSLPVLTRDYLYFGNHFTFADALSGFFVYFVNDTRDLRLDEVSSRGSTLPVATVVL